MGTGCELVGVGGVLGDEGAGCAEGVRAGAELEEGAGEEEEPGQYLLKEFGARGR